MGLLTGAPEEGSPDSGPGFGIYIYRTAMPRARMGVWTSFPLLSLAGMAPPPITSNPVEIARWDLKQTLFTMIENGLATQRLAERIEDPADAGVGRLLATIPLVASVHFQEKGLSRDCFRRVGVPPKMGRGGRLEIAYSLHPLLAARGSNYATHTGDHPLR